MKTRRNGTKARQKPHRKNTESYSSISNMTQGHSDVMWAPRGLGSPSLVLAVYNPCDLFLRPKSSWVDIANTGISILSGSPLKPWLYIHISTHHLLRDYLPWLWHTFLGLWNLHDLMHFAFCIPENQHHVDNTKVYCQFEQMPNTRRSWLLCPLSARVDVHGIINPGETDF